MFEGGYKNRKKITAPNRGYGVLEKPEPIYRYPESHPCYGCVFVFHINKPSCMTGAHPDADNCINAFYKKMLARQRTEYEKRMNQTGQKE